MSASGGRTAVRPSAADAAALRSLLSAYQVVTKTLDIELENKHGLSLGSYEVLARIADSPRRTLRMRDLANQALISRAGLVRRVNRLELAGLVRRDRVGEDGRGRLAAITPAGLQALRAARPTVAATLRKRFADSFATDELSDLTDLLTRIRA